MPNAERKPGYYRVKRGLVWLIAYYAEVVMRDRWFLPTWSDTLNDSDFDAIDETPIDPNPPAPDDNLNN